jgi:hypothetical protein
MTDPIPFYDVPCTTGTLAARPAAASLAHCFYSATDGGGGLLFFSDGTVWLNVIFGSDEAVPGGPAVLASGILSYFDSKTGAPHNVSAR